MKAHSNPLHGMVTSRIVKRKKAELEAFKQNILKCQATEADDDYES